MATQHGERKIPPSLWPTIITHAFADGWPSTKICVWLTEEHGISVHENYMMRRLHKIRQEREDVSHDVLKTELEKYLTADLLRLEGAILRAHNDEVEARKFRDTKKPGAESWVRLSAQARGHRNDLMRGLEVRLKLAGADPNMKSGPVGVVFLPAEEE